MMKNKTVSASASLLKTQILHYSRIVLGMLILLLWAADATAAAAQQTEQHDNVLRATLDNGLRVVIIRNTLAPVVTTEMNYLVGSNETPKDFPGTAHALEHMMFRGSPDLSAAQLAAISASMGGMFNADTQQTVTQYFFTVPAEDLDVALHIEALRMRGILATDQLWSEERGAIEQEVAQDLSNPQYVFYTKLLATLFKGTPYEHDPLGTRPSFNKTTGMMLKRFHDTWYAPNNAILVIAGNVQPEAALDEVKTLFGKIPARDLPPRPAVKLQPVQPGALRLKTDQPYGLAVFAFRMPGYDSPDFAAAQVLEDVLSSRRGSLYALVPEGKALNADFDMEMLPKAGLGYASATFPAGGNGGALIDELRAILVDIAKNGVPPDLVTAAKRQERMELELQKNSVSALANIWSQALAVEGRQSPEDDIAAIERVTVEDVNRVAKKYLDLDHAVTAILTPQVSGKPVSSKGFGGAESFTPTQAKPVELPAWAERAVRRLAVPDSVVDPVVKTLPNGLTLIIQPESVSGTINLYGHVRNRPELETPKGQEGVDEVLGRLFSFGTTSLDRLAFEKALDDIGARASAGMDFSLHVLTEHFERGVELLADNELHPALPEPAFNIVRRQVKGAVAGRLASPDYQTDRAVTAALFPKDDPEQREATPASVSSLTLENVRQYYQHVVRPDLTTIVVIGKVTPEQATRVIEKYFGGWQATGPKPETVLPPVPLNSPSGAVVPDASRVQDNVLLMETLALNRHSPDYYALQLGNHVLGGGFYATRLYRDLREKSGLVYFVDSSFEVGRTRAVYTVAYACDPPNVGKAHAIVAQNLKQMQSAAISPDELHQAKASLLRAIPLSESSLGSIANGLISRVELELPLDEPTRAAHHYLELNAEQVKAAFAKWVDPSRLVQVVQGPNPK